MHYYLRICLSISFIIACNGMTMKQIRQTGKMMRNTCQPKFKVDNEMLDGINTGNFVEDPEVMCYVACILKMASTIKNGKVNIEASLKQADLLLPPDIKEPAKKAINTCRNIPDQYKDTCQQAFYMTKCLYNADQSIFYFP